MSSPRRPDAATLARYFPSVTTADKIPQPAAKLAAASPIEVAVSDDPKEGVRWTRQLRLAANALGVHGFYVVASEGPSSHTYYHPDGITVKRRIGHNRACWPVMVGADSTGSKPWRDKKTWFVNKTPYERIEVKTWLWLPNADDAASLAVEIGDVLRTAAEEAGYEQLAGEFIDAGQNFKRVDFEKYVLQIARNGTETMRPMVVWNTDGLFSFCERMVRVAKIKGLGILDIGDRLVGQLLEEEKRKQCVGRRGEA